MGMNPGGDANEPRSIKSNLCAPKGKNSYADECWACSDGGYECSHCENGRLNPEKRDIIQKRVCDLFAALGSQPKDIISTNFIFARSTEFSKVAEKAEWIRRCWNVHKELLSIVRPSWVITLGFGEVFSALGRTDKAVELSEHKQNSVESGNGRYGWHRRLKFRLANGELHEAGVLGIPHPGHRGFNRAGLNGAKQYPDALKDFIARRLL